MVSAVAKALARGVELVAVIWFTYLRDVLLYYGVMSK